MTDSIEIEYTTTQVDSFNFNIVLDLDHQPGEIDFGDYYQDLPDCVLVRDGGVIGCTVRGVKRVNQDQFDYIRGEGYTLAAVYDGHGGSAVSFYLKQHLLSSIDSHPKLLEDPALAIRECFQQVETTVLERFAPDCGSTALVVLWKGQEVYVANVGDGLCHGFIDNSSTMEYLSPCIQRKSTYKKKQLNNPHTLQTEQQRKQIRSRGGIILKQRNSYRVEGQLNLSRSIGDKKYKQWISGNPCINKYTQDFTHLVLVSDGFEHLMQDIRTPEDVYAIVEGVHSVKDNATIVVLRRDMGDVVVW